MSGKREEKKRKKRLKARKAKVDNKLAGEDAQPDLGHLAPAWQKFYLMVIEELS